MIRWLRKHREEQEEFYRALGYGDGLENYPVDRVPRRYNRIYCLAYGRGRMARLEEQRDHTDR
jgi:hypothetical protein